MVTVVECQPSGKGRQKVAFDNGVSCLLYRGELRWLQIAEGESLSEEAYEELMTGVLGKRAKKRALYLLEQMDRSEYNLREKLAQSGYPAVCIDAAIDYVKSFHYLDDHRYATNFVCCLQGKLSRGQIRQKLLSRGIRGDVIDQAIEEEYEEDESHLIRNLLSKRHYDPETADSKEFSRTYQYLMRRGFSGSEVLRLMRVSG